MMAKILQSAFIITLMVCGTAYAGMAGNYSLINNECEDDGGPIIVEESGGQVIFHGGFDKAAGLYYGSLSGNNVEFTHADGSCKATLKGGVLAGICEFPDEACDFEYKRGK